MKTTRRTFIKQSTMASLAAIGMGPLLWTDISCAQGTATPANGGAPAQPANVDIPAFLKSAPALAGSADFQKYLAPIYDNDKRAEINRVPYISQYYIQHKVDAGKDVVINYYVTDYHQSEYMFDDTSQTFTVEYWINGAKSTLRNIKAGDNSFTVKGLPKGKVLLALQVTDSQGRKSHRLFQEFLVVGPNEEAIPENKIYHPDLQKFGIYNDDTHPVETTKGLTDMLQWAHDNGYRKVLLPRGRYRLDENDTVQMATNLTLDMNGSTFKLNPNALAKAMMLAMIECVDSHVINGTFEGDLKEHDFKTAPNNSEWVCAVLIGPDSLYCSYENIKVVDVTGYGTNTSMSGAGSRKPKLGYSADYPKPAGPFVSGDIDEQGNLTQSGARLTSEKPVDISKFAASFGFLQMGVYLGYQGNPAGSWVYKASFYDANQKYIESIEGYMYRRMYIPQGAKFARFTLLSDATPDSVKNLSLFNFRQPYNCTFRNVIHENVRCVGMCPSGFYNLLVEGCTFENCGSSSAKCAFDAEDGWDMMQDLTFRNNTFGTNPHNEFLTCDGMNFVLENNVMSTMMWDRTKGSVYRNNKLKSGTFRFGNRNRTGYARIYNNTIEGNASLDTATAEPDCGYCARDNAIQGGISAYRGKGILVDAAYFYKCKIDGGKLASVAYDCDIKNIQNPGGKLHIYGGTIDDSQLKISDVGARSMIAGCVIKNSHVMNINSAMTLKNNTITDTAFEGSSSWIETMEYIFIGNTITTSQDYLILMGNSFQKVLLENNVITSSNPKFNGILLKNPQAKNAKALTVAITKSTFTGKGGLAINVAAAPAADTLLTIYAKGNTYTGLEAINDKAFDMKTVKLLEEGPPA
jgi:hypothetical protein